MYMNTTHGISLFSCRRKAQWEKDTFDGPSPAFQHRLFQDVVKDVFFTCTVEVNCYRTDLSAAVADI